AKNSKLKNIFYKRNGQLALGGNGGAIELIERVKQRAHFPVQAFKQEPTHVFRQVKSAQSGAQLKCLEFVFIRQRLQLVDLSPVQTRRQIRQPQIELTRRTIASDQQPGFARLQNAVVEVKDRHFPRFVPRHAFDIIDADQGE